MDRKRGKYVVNIEHSENQLPITCSDDQQAHSSACWHPPSSGTTGHVSSNLTGVYVSPAALAHSRNPHTELSSTEAKGNWCNDLSLWKVFLACLLACVITTATGVLIIHLVNNRENDSSPITNQLPANNEEPILSIPGMTSTTSQPAGTTMSTEPVTKTTSTESTATATSIEPTATAAITIASTEPRTSTAITITSTEPTTSTATTITSTEPTATAAITIASTEPTTSTAITNTSNEPTTLTTTAITSTEPTTTAAITITSTEPTTSTAITIASTEPRTSTAITSPSLQLSLQP
ncbi:dynactin-associated protein-like [Prionailurus bengalensis]|uniref:dynactin-associated protein-like n=1 Tax=Prionailurus bengalensis TaxID=37029 RepID=UPI001CA86408|nr:dynactin-associated protein-like [Prionailurus bengalensis]